jgi:hypothetical protein
MPALPLRAPCAARAGPAPARTAAPPPPPPPPPALPRRAALRLLAALAAAAAPLALSTQPAAAAAAEPPAGNAAVQAALERRGLGRYVRKKRIDGVESYLAPILAARGELARVGRVMLGAPADARRLLRAGAFAGLRENVRAVGEYAADADAARGAALVTGALGALEALDGALLVASRGGGEEGGGGDAARAALDALGAALDALLAAAPADAAARARAVVAALEDGAPGGSGGGAGAPLDEAELERLQTLVR